MDESENQVDLLQIYKQVHRIRISIKDLDECIEYTKEMTHASSTIARRALLTAAIVSYVRPFSGNSNHEMAASQPKFSVSKSLTASERELHERICKIRDTSIAHSDFEMNQVQAEQFYHNGLALKTNFYDPLSELLNSEQIWSLANKVKHLLAMKMHELSSKVGGEKSSSTELLPEGVTEVNLYFKSPLLNLSQKKSSK